MNIKPTLGIIRSLPISTTNFVQMSWYMARIAGNHAVIFVIDHKVSNRRTNNGRCGKVLAAAPFVALSLMHVPGETAESIMC